MANSVTVNSLGFPDVVYHVDCYGSETVNSEFC